MPASGSSGAGVGEGLGTGLTSGVGEGVGLGEGDGETVGEGEGLSSTPTLNAKIQSGLTSASGEGEGEATALGFEVGAVGATGSFPISRNFNAVTTATTPKITVAIKITIKSIFFLSIFSTNPKPGYKPLTPLYKNLPREWYIQYKIPLHAYLWSLATHPLPHQR